MATSDSSTLSSDSGCCIKIVRSVAAQREYCSHWSTVSATELMGTGAAGVLEHSASAVSGASGHAFISRPWGEEADRRMALVPVHTPAEQCLLDGPQRLASYAGERFAWLHAITRGQCDWNTLLAIGIDAERIDAVADFFLGQPHPVAPAVHRAANVVLALATLTRSAQAMLTSLGESECARQLARPAQHEPRIVQEWRAWLLKLEGHVAQEARITATVRARLKRDAAAAELEAEPRPAPVALDE